MAIDNRLIPPNGEPEITENFNRVMGYIDEGGGGGGTGNFIVTLTYDDIDEEWDADKEPADIYDAYDEGQTVIVRIDDGETVTAATVVFADAEQDEIRATAQDGNYCLDALYNTEDGWTVNPSTILPVVESTDAGKILMVDANGDWVAGTIPNADTTLF